MARPRKQATSSILPIDHFQHEEATRRNNPDGGLAARGQIPQQPQKVYAYDPHSAPRLGFNPDGTSDRIFSILERAKKGKLNPDEIETLLEAVGHHQPWLEWTGKQEQRSTRVNPVSLHTHERVSAKAILKMLAREPVQRGLFADPELDYRKAVQFYQHDVRWSNRLILGDSLEVMTSLSEYEGLAGKVQMIYMDPPYGIKFSSNFQPLIAKREVKDGDSDLTREPEMVRAYRDTWTLGVHSYLTYLRSRLIGARDLLSDSGSIFLQISDENVHRIRILMDEIFGVQNFISQITFQKSGSTTGELLPNTADYIIWYAKSKEKIKFNNLYLVKNAGGLGGQKYNSIELENGLRLPTSQISEDTTEQWFGRF